MATPCQFPLRTLLLAVVPVAAVVLPVGWHLRRPKPPQPVPVSGFVTLDGVPLDGADVLFCNDYTLPTGGTTDANGRFVLKTWGVTKDQQGALPNFYKVVVVKALEIGPFRDVSGKEVEPGEMGISEIFGTIKFLTPERYRDGSTSGLSAEVTQDGPNAFTFNLTTP